MKNSKYHTSSLTSYLLVLLSVILIAPSAFAQQAVTAPPPTGPATPSAARADAQGNALPAAGGEAATERIFVTGSIIPTANEVGPNPVIRADRALIDKTVE